MLLFHLKCLSLQTSTYNLGRAEWRTSKVSKPLPILFLSDDNFLIYSYILFSATFVIPEVMNQIAYKVMGNELCVTMAGEAAQMELNAMEPVMAQCCFESVDLLINGFDTLRTRCVDGIVANEDRCREEVHHSIGVVTALNPVIGYKNSTKIAKEALETGVSVYQLVLDHGILTKEELDTILSPENMIKPVKLDIKPRR